MLSMSIHIAESSVLATVVDGADTPVFRNTDAAGADTRTIYIYIYMYIYIYICIDIYIYIYIYIYIDR